MNVLRLLLVASLLAPCAPASAQDATQHGNKGEEAALAAIEMHNLLEKLP